MLPPITSRGSYKGTKGKFSTVRLPNGLLETCFFPDDDTDSVVLASSGWGGIDAAHRLHVAEYRD